jgi:hypothetical protein
MFRDCCEVYQQAPAAEMLAPQTFREPKLLTDKAGLEG